MTTASSYTYDTAGNRASKSAAGAIADYSWDAEGLLSAVTGDPDQNGEYVYDASGQRLVRTDAAGTRVFLPGGQEILIVGTSVSAMRYYSFGGTSVAVRTGPGMGGVSSLVCDAHGSVVASVPNTVWTAGSVKRVFSDPFGAVREGSDATGSGGHQFLGAVRDTSSGLTLLGARYYDGSVGRFISVDPVLDPGLPAQFNAYVYSGNNPATWSDPSGTLWQGGQWRSDAPAASSSSGVKKKTGTTVPASTSPAALQQCPDVSCRASWLVGFQVQMFGGIAEGIGALLWMTCVLCTTVQSTVENFDMFTDWDGFTARKMAEAQAQQALFAAGPGAVWDAITKPIVDDWANNPGHALGGTLVTVGTFAIPGGGVLKGVRGVKAAEEAVTTAADAGMAGVRAAGATGEAMVGIVKNTTRIPSASGKAAYRIPDELNSSVLGEVKNVSHLNYTSQLRDFAAYARQEGLTFTLYTRGSTTFSSTLQAEINAGRIVLDSTRLGP